MLQEKIGERFFWGNYGEKVKYYNSAFLIACYIKNAEL